MNNLNRLLQSLCDCNEVKDFYLHRNYGTGELELNIEFEKPNELKEDFDNFGIKEIEKSAYWE